MSLSEKNIFGAIRAFTFNAKTNGPGTSTPLSASGLYTSSWVEVTDYAKIVGTCYISGSAMATASARDIMITNVSLGDKFYITGSDSTIYTYSASADTTSSLIQDITSVALGNEFFITGSGGTIYIYSSSANITSSISFQDITSVALGNEFFITGSGGTIYTYSSSGDFTASLTQTITSISSSDKIFITGSSGVIYTYSASDQAPTPTDTGSIYYFATGSVPSASLINLHEEINNSSLSASISSSVTETTIHLSAKNTGSAVNGWGFQSGSTQTLFAGGSLLPADSGNTYYFTSGSDLLTGVINLHEEINNSSVNTSISASISASFLHLSAKNTGSAVNGWGFQSGSTQILFAGGDWIPPDSGNTYYFTSGSDLLNGVINLHEEINNSSINAYVSASISASFLHLSSTNTGSTVDGWGFQSGSTQILFTGGGWLPPDIAGNIYYFPSASTLSVTVGNLNEEINNSSVSSFLSSSIVVDTTMSLYAVVKSDTGDLLGFQSGSTQYPLSRALPANGVGPEGTLYIQQTPNTSSADLTGSVITVNDDIGVSFSQDLYSTYVRLRYEETGSTGQFTFRLISYLTP